MNLQKLHKEKILFVTITQNSRTALFSVTEFQRWYGCIS